MVFLADSDGRHDVVLFASLLDDPLLDASDDEGVGVVLRDEP